MSRTTEHLILAALERTYTIVEIQQDIYRAAAYGRYSSRQIGCMYAMRTLYQGFLKNLKDSYHSFVESLKSKKRKNVRLCGFF